MPRASNRKSMVSGGEESHLNVVELKAAKLAIMNFTMKKKNRISTYVRMDKMVASSYVLSNENGGGGHKKPGISHHQQRNLGFPLAPQDHSYCPST